jgi:hypothetical protein
VHGKNSVKFSMLEGSKSKTYSEKKDSIATPSYEWGPANRIQTCDVRIANMTEDISKDDERL